jgi:methionine-gamma-lyase
MTRAGENAAKVCAFFRDHPRSSPSAISGSSAKAARPTSTAATAWAPGRPSRSTSTGGEREAFAFLDSLKIAKLAVSLGGTETLASAPAAMTHLSVPDARKLAMGITDNLVRISIGWRTPTISSQTSTRR